MDLDLVAVEAMFQVVTGSGRVVVEAVDIVAREQRGIGA